jgi:cytochrome c-type biogenesis protein CcmH
MALVLVVALVVGGRGSSGPMTEAARSLRITSEIRCPTCRGLSVAESDASTALAVRTVVAQQVHQGRSDGEIKRYLVDRYGSDILLKPPSSGFDGLVWFLPPVGLIIAVAGLTVTFRRWKSGSDRKVSADDRAIVAEAMSARE